MKPKYVPLLLLAACSATPEDPDPHKDFNQSMMEFNVALDKNLLKPAANVYEGITNEATSTMISNFFDNLNEPYYFVNYTLQFSGEGIATSVFRFIINSTLGVLGFVDIAELMGAPKHKTGYKNTLHKLGVPTQDYIVLPILGPSSTRDVVAEPISWFADPFIYCVNWPISISKSILQAIINRSENKNMVDSVLYNSIDTYAVTRSMYLQAYGDASNDDDDIDEDDE